MIIHTYFTNGYFNWATLFIESFKHHHGEKYKMVIDAVDINDKQANKLKQLYNNIDIRVIKLNWNELQKKSGVNKNVLNRYKTTTENKKVNANNKVWKLMIAGDHRIKKINQLLLELPDGEHIAHFDIDTYVTGNMEELFDFVRKNDFCTRYRIEKQIKRKGRVFRENRATLIYFQGYTVNDRSKKFMERWIHYIDNKEPKKRNKGFGQSTCYWAYLDMKKDKNFKTGDTKQYQKWGNANKGSKNSSYNKFRKSFEQIRINSEKG